MLNKTIFKSFKARVKNLRSYIFLLTTYLFINFIFKCLIYKLGLIKVESIRPDLVRLFCVTKGKSNDQFSKLVKWMSPTADFQHDGFLVNEISNCQKALDKDGYYVFNIKLSDRDQANLVKLSEELSCVVRPKANDSCTDKIKIKMDRHNPVAIRYDYEPKELINNETVQKIITDPSLLKIAQDYLGSLPLFDFVAMWWSTKSDKPDGEAAQLYHFDMDNIKWVKFFFYLTDVTEHSGPHCFISGSHVSGTIPKSFLEKGYARITDDEVFSAFPKSKEIKMIGQRGTILAEDTRGLHKGLNIAEGDRLIFQIQYSNTKLFSNPSVHCMNPTEELNQAIKKWPKIFSNVQV